jgi:disulfide oxidoreductase YuzD
MKKKTAVDWLQEAISKKLSSEISPFFLDLFDQALEMERQQIINACYNGSQLLPYEVRDKAEQYYTQTFTEPKND